MTLRSGDVTGFSLFDKSSLVVDAAEMRFYAILAIILPLAGGCASPPPVVTSVHDLNIDVRTETRILVPRSGQPLDWNGVMAIVAEHDVVLVGEQHDDPVGHGIELALVEDVLDGWPKSVVAMEMLERDEQLLVEDYFDDVIDAEQFEKLTFSTNWFGNGGWIGWYQPIIDAVKSRGGRLIAANAPRRYVRMARSGGYEKIGALSEDRRLLVDFPDELSGGRYRERFWELAGVHGEDEGVEQVDAVDIDPDDPILPFYRSQQTWDATMAQSVVNAMSHEGKVVLLVGQFHVEYDGGIVQELRRRAPRASVLVISLQRTIPEDEDWDGELPIADIVILTEQ